MSRSRYYNPEKKREYYLKNKEKIIAKSLENNRKNRVRRNELARQRRLQARLQNTKSCPLCGNKRLMTFDHCHRTGLERGWICRQCNCMLGMADDNIETLTRAIAYLRDFARRHDVSI